tara:strand:+ start:28319 stop:29341 length:1023 start_codon:yes stop_codon:yes gene_type:complete
LEQGITKKLSFALIVCTYKRPKPLLSLLDSVVLQSYLPDQILIIDGSEDDETKIALQEKNHQNLDYFKVDAQDRGLTRQRNFGISKVNRDIEVVCFLDDDTILEPDYFKNLIKTYQEFPNALGVGGYITNEVAWEKKPFGFKPKKNEFYFDGYYRKDGSRFVLRKKLGLDADRPPAHFPDFGHGRSVSFLPPSGKIYEVEQFMGGVASYRKEVFAKLGFSKYFEGYGLYEDADFTLRLSKTGKLYVNTSACLEHHHDPSGRPDMFKYGKMVVRNGWYVWRVKYPNPSLKARLKWNTTAFLLTLIRALNIITTSQKKMALQETLGRMVGWFSIMLNRPKVQ